MQPADKGEHRKMVPIRWKVLPWSEAQPPPSRQIKTEEGLEIKVKEEAQEIEVKVEDEEELSLPQAIEVKVEAQAQEIEVKVEEVEDEEELPLPLAQEIEVKVEAQALEIEVKVEDEEELPLPLAQALEIEVKVEEVEDEEALALALAQAAEIEVQVEEEEDEEAQEIEKLRKKDKRGERGHASTYEGSIPEYPYSTRHYNNRRPISIPPKKKCKIAKPNAYPGKARAHLEVNFSVLPGSKGDLKNGHIFYLYTSFGKSVSETVRLLSSHFSLSDAEGYSFATKVRNFMKRKFSWRKFCYIHSPKKLGAFMKFCDGAFKLTKSSQRMSLHDIPPPGAQDPESLTFAEIQVPIFQDTEDMGDDSHSLYPPLNLATPRTAAASSLTPREQKMKKRLNFLSRSKVVLARKYRTRISELRAQLKTPKHVVNQALEAKQNRIDLKDRKIQELKTKLRGTTLARELAETKAEFLKLKKAHRELRKFRGSKKKGKTVSIQQYRKVQEKLKDREEYVRRLKFDNLVLKEAIESLETTLQI